MEIIDTTAIGEIVIATNLDVDKKMYKLEAGFVLAFFKYFSDEKYIQITN